MDQSQPLNLGKEELKSAKTMSMELFVMTSGIDLMEMLSVDSSTSQLVCDVIKNKEPVSMSSSFAISAGSLPVSGRDSVYGAGNASILLDDLECSGDEDNLFQCQRKAGFHDCTHDEDAAVVCMGRSSLIQRLVSCMYLWPRNTYL